MKSRWSLLAAALALGAATSAPVAVAQSEEGLAHSNRARAANDIYIVRMADRPAVAYDGGVPGYAATRPKKGAKIDPNDAKVVRYAGYLDSKHDEAVARVGARKVYGYRYAFNGFAAKMSPAQAEVLKSAPGVLAVDKDVAYAMDTSTTPTFLGLSQPAPVGFWARTGARGEDVIIGMVDSGIWPEHPSFSDRTGTNGNGTQDGRLDYQQIPGWHGKCTPGEEFNASNCNQKLIGARYYNDGWGGNAEIDRLFPFEFNSPRDWAGHGTHTSSTAGGNSGVPATGATSAFGNVSGIAPRARIATYKVCWADQPTGGGCFGSDSVAAIDQAVADGVDVINFSISGTSTNFRDPVEIAFMFAADAGVFVAASAGNAGTTGSVAHPGPWLTTVAAGTHNRDGIGSVTLGNGTTYTGSSYANALASTPLIDSASAGLAGADPVKVELCYGAGDNAGVPVLDPAKVAGKIVLCKRGVTALVNKTGAVAAAGGVGAVIYNDPAGATTTLAIVHAVPTVHVIAASGLAIKAYIALSPSTATSSIAQSTIVLTAAAPFTASFSSRGPLTAGGGDLLKPDLMAPGQDILAGVAPPNNFGRLFDLYSGTSMSSPHVAGLAALFKQVHPSWSPMAIKSALMTSAGDVLDGPNTNPLVIFRQGAGHVQPNKAENPGLVFDSGFADWLGFLCGTQLPVSFCADAGVPVLDPSNFNGASIAIGDMAGTQTVKRRVTNVSGGPATFIASTTGMSGITVLVTPATLTLAPNETAEFTVKFTRTTAAANAYVGGQLTWTNGTQSVRIPMVVRPVALAAPVEVSTSSNSSASYGVTFGYAGTFTTTPRGLVPAAITAGTVTQDPDQTFDPADSAGTVAIPVTIPAGSTYARFGLFDADVTAGSDIDLFVYQGATLVGASTTGTSAETVNFVFATPTAAAIPLTVYVHGFSVAGGSSPFKLHTWYLGTAAAGNMTATPSTATATIAGTATVTLGFSGLTSGTKYLGSVVYGGTTGMPSPTIVRVDP